MKSKISEPEGKEGFATLGLEPKLLSTLAALGYEEPTPVQSAAIPPLLAGRDVLGQAATGTGKTAAFALPILQRTQHMFGGKKTGALVLVPTRELAMQVAEAVHRYGKALAVRVLPIYGGQSMEPQLRALDRGVHVVVATPGRALDHLRRKTLDLRAVQTVVLDEADEMLDMGFAEDLEAILETIPKERQTALFSATMPKRIATIAERHLRDPVRVAIAKSTMVGDVPQVRQIAYVAPRQQKLSILERVLDMENPASALIFCRTRLDVDRLTESLNGHGHRAEALHGGMSQQHRDRVMKKFREGVTELLVATDVAARGLDIKNLSHVINFDMPSASEAYVHRIGRTGRAGRAGTAILIVEPRETRQLNFLERITKQRIEEGRVPTSADLRARRLEMLRVRLEEVLTEGHLDAHRSLLDGLGETHHLADVAAAALKLADLTLSGGPARTVAPVAELAPVAVLRRAPERPLAMAKLYLAIGRDGGIGPTDILAAINSAASSGRHVIGKIDIFERHSVVEVPEEAVADLLAKLSKVLIRGKKVKARRFRDDSKG